MTRYNTVKKTTTAGFEPTLPKGNCLAGNRLNHSATLSSNILMNNIEMAIKDLYVRDLGYHRGTKYPKSEKVEELIALSNQLRDLAIDNKKTTGKVKFEQEAKEVLFKKKRAAELARLLEAKIIFNKYHIISIFMKGILII